MDFNFMEYTVHRCDVYRGSILTVYLNVRYVYIEDCIKCVRQLRVFQLSKNGVSMCARSNKFKWMAYVGADNVCDVLVLYPYTHTSAQAHTHRGSAKEEEWEYMCIYMEAFSMGFPFEFICHRVSFKWEHRRHIQSTRFRRLCCHMQFCVCVRTFLNIFGWMCVCVHVYPIWCQAIKINYTRLEGAELSVCQWDHFRYAIWYCYCKRNTLCTIWKMTQECAMKSIK